MRIDLEDISVTMFPDVSYLGNTVATYALALGLFGGGLIITTIIHKYIFKRLKSWAARQNAILDSRIMGKLDRATLYLLYLSCFWIGISSLNLSEFGRDLVGRLTTAFATVIIVQLITSLLEYGIRYYWMKSQRSEAFEASFSALVPAIRAIVWSMALIFLLDNFGFDISAVVASLGIGGIAVAFAAQGILADLFSYFSIILDRPFEIGDFVIVGDLKGTIEHIGIKTTRLRSINGEQLIASNTDLTDSRIQNFKRMERRRIVFNLGVTYETGEHQLEKIPHLIQSVIAKVDNVTFDRAHFLSFGDFSLDFEVVYFVESSAYDIYMDAQQSINLGIKELFAANKIEFAFPTQTLYLQGQNVANSAKNGFTEHLLNN